MAGKRQHYIPRLLQRGFLYDPQEGAERTWLHRRGAEARLVGIRDVGVSEYFYSKVRADGVATLDDFITAIEGSLDSEVTALGDKPTGEPVDSAAAARLTTHLLLRTAHLRSVFPQGATQILDGVALLFTDTAAMRGFLGVDGLDDSSPFETELDKAVHQLPLEAPVPRLLARRIAGFWAREKFDTLFGDSRAMIASAMSKFKNQIPALVRDAHNRTLETSNGERWEEYLRELHWRTEATSGAVLPDCVVLAREASHDFTPFLLSGRDSVELLVIPLAHDRLLVGSRGFNDPIAAETLNAASAACSDNFFISRSAADGAGLSGLIGQRSAKVIETSVAEALSDSRPRDVVTDYIPSVTGTQSDASFAFSLTCAGLLDADMTSQIGEIIKTIVGELSRTMSLSTLDGITFSADYPTAVKNIDRGDPSLGMDQSEPREYGRAIAKPVQVSRNGISKTHLVLDIIVAEGLLSDNRSEGADAVHTVVSMLAGVAHTARYSKVLAERTTGPHDELVRFLHQSVSTAPGSYFAARESAFSNPAAGQRYSALVMDSLASARKAIERARLQYRVNDNLDDLLSVALPQISFFLSHAAEWLGHRDGLPDQYEFPGASLTNELRSLDLLDWLELFGRDLRTLYSADDSFTSTRIFALSRHVERLLWTVQIFPWLLEDGSVFISVPWGEDASRLESSLSAASGQSGDPP